MMVNQAAFPNADPNTAHAEIRLFQPGDEQAFRELNEAWIRRYFAIEQKDAEVLGNPQKYILSRGGQIVVAVADGKPVGCCALIPLEAGTFEVAKMAVSDEYQGRGIGKRILLAAIESARKLGAKRLYLESNRKLAPALRLYESVGFVHLPADRIPPSPYTRCDVYMELDL